MFHVFAAGKENCVKFKHEYEMKKIVQKDGVEVDQKHPRKTSCAIIVGEDTLGEGVAMCDPRDQFEYAKGRKRSLKRALAATGFDRAARKEVWDAFNSN